MFLYIFFFLTSSSRYRRKGIGYMPLVSFYDISRVDIIFLASRRKFFFSPAIEPFLFRFADRLIIDEDGTLLDTFMYLPRLLPHIIEEFWMFVQSDL